VPRFVERIADHAANIAGDVIDMVEAISSAIRNRLKMKMNNQI